MLKTINLMVRGHFVDIVVDLDKLTWTAKLLASMILTTDNRDDASWVNVTSKIPLREQIVKDGTDPNTYAEFGAPEMLDAHQTIRWIWDALRPNEIERPELYFERHAQEIENTGTFVNTEFACGMLSVPKELKKMLDLYEAAEETGITIDELLQAIESGIFETGECIKTYSTFLISKDALKRIFNS
jgi:hypothetical protein